MASAVLVASLFVASCSDDDDKSAGNVPNGPTAIYDGNLLTGAGSYVFNYDDMGRCISASLRALSYDDVDQWVSARGGDYDLFKIDYEAGKVKMEDEDLWYNISFTNDGYISRIWFNESMKEGAYSVKIDAEMLFSYDEDGHLVAGLESVYANVFLPDEKYETKGLVTVKMTWKDGNMVKVEETESGYNEDGVIDGASEYTLVYSDVENKFKQWTLAMDETTMVCEAFGFVGLLGRGTSNYVRYYEYEYDEDDRTETYRTDTSYDINDNGTINMEIQDDFPCNYSYGKFDNGSQSMPALKPENKASRPVGIFSDMHNKVREFRAKYGVNK